MGWLMMLYWPVGFRLDFNECMRRRPHFRCQRHRHNMKRSPYQLFTSNQPSDDDNGIKEFQSAQISFNDSVCMFNSENVENPFSAIRRVVVIFQKFPFVLFLFRFIFYSYSFLKKPLFWRWLNKHNFLMRSDNINNIFKIIFEGSSHLNLKVNG